MGPFLWPHPIRRVTLRTRPRPDRSTGPIPVALPTCRRRLKYDRHESVIRMKVHIVSLIRTQWIVTTTTSYESENPSMWYKRAVLAQRWPCDARYISGSSEPLRRYGHWKLSKMSACRQLGFDVTGNSAIRSADPENLTLEPNMKCIGSPVAEI